MRPKLKADTFCIPAPDGVHIRSGAQWFKLGGKTSYSWIERLAPHLNGRLSLEELAGGLPEDKRQMVVQIVEVLAQHGCVVDYAQDAPHTLSEDEQTAYAAEIAFVESFGGNAPQRFQRFRESRVLLVGAGLTLTALVYAALRCGLRRPTVLVADECATSTARHDEYLRLLRERDPRLELTAAVPDWEHEKDLAELVGGFDAVLHLSDRPMLGRARLLNRACAARSTLLLQALPAADTAWIGPLVRPGEPGCWECAWRRLLDNRRDDGLPHQPLRDRPDAAPEPFLTATTAALVANTLCFELFKSLSEAGPLETAGQMVRIDLETLQSQSFAYAPHPLCESCAAPEPSDAGEARAAFALAAERPPDTDEQFSQRAVRCFDRELGVFSSLDERDFAQLPLHIAQVTVAHPLSSLKASLAAFGAGLEPGLARRRATRRALELYAACMFDARRLSHPARAAGAPHSDERTQALLWAYDLHACDAVPVAAELVFPALRGLVPSEQSMPGLASGLCWDEAVVRGLTGLARELTLAQLDGARGPFGLVDLAATPLDEECTRLRAILAIGGEAVQIYDVSGPLGVTVLALTLGGRTVGYSADLDPLVALAQGLELLVLSQQSRANGQPAYAPPPAPELPATRRGASAAPLEGRVTGGWAARRQTLLRAFARCRYHALAAPLDHDPLVAGVLPAVVHVLAIREAV